MTVWGEQDIIIPISHADEIRQELPNSTVSPFPNADIGLTWKSPRSLTTC